MDRVCWWRNRLWDYSIYNWTGLHLSRRCEVLSANRIRNNPSWWWWLPYNYSWMWRLIYWIPLHWNWLRRGQRSNLNYLWRKNYPWVIGTHNYSWPFRRNNSNRYSWIQILSRSSNSYFLFTVNVLIFLFNLVNFCSPPVELGLFWFLFFFLRFRLILDFLLIFNIFLAILFIDSFVHIKYSFH